MVDFIMYSSYCLEERINSIHQYLIINSKAKKIQGDSRI